jgi:hypothetical protein
VEILNIEDTSELIYVTYYMIEWDKVKQELSEMKCVECGNALYETEYFEDKRKKRFRGMVCHKCRRVLWLKS